MILILTYSFIISTFLLPALFQLPGLPEIRPEDLILSVFFVSLFLKKTNKQSVSKDERRYLVQPVWAILYFALLSILLQEVLWGIKLVPNDFMMIPMVGKYILAMKLVWEVFNKGNYQIQILSCIFLCGIVAAIVGILQYQNLFGINQWLSPLFSPSKSALATLQTQHFARRAIGTVGDPRHFGFLLVTTASSGLTLYSFHPSKRIYFLFGIVIIFIGIITTLSRTTVFGFFITCFTILFIYLKLNKKLFSFIPALFFIIILLAGIINAVSNENFQNRVLNTQTISFKSSENARIRDLLTPFKESIQHPQYILLGMGPAKNIMRTSSHSDFGWFYQRYGIIGLFLYLLLFYRGISLFWSNIKNNNLNQTPLTMIFAFLILLNWFLYANAEDMFKKTQLMPIILFTYGLLALTQKNLELISYDRGE